MIRLTLFLALLSCGNEGTKVVYTPAPAAPVPEQADPLTKCDEQTELAEWKILPCGFGEDGSRVMVCTKLGWAEAFDSCLFQSTQPKPILPRKEETPRQVN